MKVLLKGQELNLKSLTDREWDEAVRLARRNHIPLNQCPTCKTRWTDIPESHGVKEFKNGTYRYKGQTYDCDCQAQMALRARYLLANIGMQYQTLDWAEYNGPENVREEVKTYLDNWVGFKDQGFGIEFGGKALGVGKTYAATYIGKELIKKRQPVYFCSFSDVVQAFSHNESPKMVTRLRDTTYLILDELLEAGSEAQHALFATQLEALIRHRTNHNLPTIITTNLSQKELDEAYSRSYSLLAAKQLRVDMSGDDARRGKIALENAEIAMNGEVRAIT